MTPLYMDRPEPDDTIFTAFVTEARCMTSYKGQHHCLFATAASCACKHMLADYAHHTHQLENEAKKHYDGIPELMSC